MTKGAHARPTLGARIPPAQRSTAHRGRALGRHHREPRVAGADRRRSWQEPAADQHRPVQGPRAPRPHHPRRHNCRARAVIDGFGGIVRLDEIGARFEEEWPAGVVTGAGIVRLLVRVSSGRAHIFEVDGADQPLVARPLFDRETLKAFAAEVVRLAGQWPPVEPDTARRTLAGSCRTSRGSARPWRTALRGRRDRGDRPPLHRADRPEAQHRFRPRPDAGSHRARRPRAASAARIRPAHAISRCGPPALDPARPRLPRAGADGRARSDGVHHCGAGARVRRATDLARQRAQPRRRRARHAPRRRDVPRLPNAGHASRAPSGGRPLRRDAPSVASGCRSKTRSSRITLQRCRRSSAPSASSPSAML